MESIKKQSTVDLASKGIIKFLETGDLEVGDKLPTEQAMCAKLGISRATLREVYRRLQSQGYVELENGRGAFVRSKSIDPVQQATNWFRLHDAQMREYLEVRMSLDPLAARLAAMKRTEEDIAVLNQIQKEFEDCQKNHDSAQMAILDARFHEKIVNITHNELLIALVRLVNYYFEKLRQTSFGIEEHASHAIEPHKRILEAIAAGDADKAANESVAHMKTAFKDLCGEEIL